MVEQKCDTDKCLALNIAKENKEDIEMLKKSKEQSNITMAVLGEKLDTFMDSQKTAMITLGLKIDELTSKPAKRWEAVIGAGIGAIVVYFITQFLG